MDINSNSITNSEEPSQIDKATYASDPEIITLKLVSTRTHVGPAKRKNKASALVSAAANKIRLNNDLKVTLNDPSSEPAKKSSPTNRSLSIANKDGKIKVADAFAFMVAWDELFGDMPGTKDYIEKANKLDAARSQVYAELGINPDSKVRPELSEEQRVAYSEAVIPYSFDYYEVRLSFKQPGRKAVRSRTYRYLEAPDLASIRARLIKQQRVVKSEFQVSTRFIGD